MISAVELTKRFEHSGHDVLAVDRVSFRVERGEVYGLLGENGAERSGGTRATNLLRLREVLRDAREPRGLRCRQPA